MHFHPALGDPEGLHERERGLFESEGFTPLAPSYAMPKQGFTEYLESSPSYPKAPRTACYLQVLPDGSDNPAFHACLTDHLEAFFGWQVRSLSLCAPGANAVIKDSNSSAQESAQIWASDVFEQMRRTLPADAYCVVNLTYVDLYPEPSMVFLFSHRPVPPADLFSFFRVDATGHGSIPKDAWARCAKTIAHELCHLLGLAHCVFFRCLMNPGLATASSEPQHFSAPPKNAFALCPICLRKLAYACALDVRSRYQKLAGISDRLGCPAQAEWFRARLSRTPGAFPIEWSP